MTHAVRRSSPTRADSSVPSPTRPKRNLKRTASQALLLTPPRTVKRERRRCTGKRTASRASTSRSRSRGSGHETEHDATDNEDEQVSLGDGVGRRLDFGPVAKKRRLEDLDARLETLLEAPDEEENPFWDGPSKAKSTETETADNLEESEIKKGSEKSKSAEKSVRVRSPTPPLLAFRGKAPVSPPPSNRRKGVATEKVVEPTVEEEVEAVVETSAEATSEPSAEATVELSAKAEDEPPAKTTGESSVVPPADQLPTVELPTMPSTPKKGKKRLVESPIRDSPNNPFLDDSPSSVIGEPAEPRTPTTHAEKPTITYVFRGVRAEFANPVYNVPVEVHERSLLPIEHPDFSPDPTCPPKLLFTKPCRRSASPSPTRKGNRKTNTRTKSAIPSGSHPDNEWDDSDDEAELHVTPPKRLFH